MESLTKLPNIGPKVAEQLVAINVNNLEELKEKGSIQAWLEIKAIDQTA